jgi:hypothetical protein
MPPAMPTMRRLPARFALSHTTLDTDDSPEKQAEARAQLGRLRKRLAETETIDFFGATGRVVVEGLIAELERRVRKEISVMTEDKATTPETLACLKGRTWVVGLIAFPLLQPTLSHREIA